MPKIFDINLHVYLSEEKKMERRGFALGKF